MQPRRTEIIFHLMWFSLHVIFLNIGVPKGSQIFIYKGARLKNHSENWWNNCSDIKFISTKEKQWIVNSINLILWTEQKELGIIWINNQDVSTHFSHINPAIQVLSLGLHLLQIALWIELVALPSSFFARIYIRQTILLWNLLCTERLSWKLE